MNSRQNGGDGRTREPRPAEVIAQLRAALISRAARLGLDPDSIASPAPGALTVRTSRGTLLRIDVCSYHAHELAR